MVGSLLAAAVLAATPAGATRSRERAAFDRGRAVWSAQHLVSYRFRLRIACDCPAATRRPMEITVRDGRPRGAGYFPGQLQTFPQMFRLIGQVLDDPAAGRVTASYDPRRGFPRSARMDAIDWSVDHFQPL